MTFQITLSEHRTDGTVVPLLFGETDIDMPTLLFAYNVQLMVLGGCVDCTRFAWSGDPAAELVRVLAQLTWNPLNEATAAGELRFRIEQEGDFLLETRPSQDPRPLLADILTGSLTSERSELELLMVLFLDAAVVEACRYAAATGWGIDSFVWLPSISELIPEADAGLVV
jgi:hypothetical protein